MNENTNSGLFTVFREQSRPLSAELSKRAVDEGGVQAALDAIETLEQLDEFELRWPSMLEVVRINPPKLNGMRPVRPTVGDYKSSGQGDGVRYPTTRHVAAAKIEGDSHLLAYWPDKLTDVLPPVDSEQRALADKSSGALDREELRQLKDAADQWNIAAGKHDDNSTTELHTYIDLTTDEEAAVATGELDIRAEFQRRYDYIEKIIFKIQEQTNGYFDRDLPALVAKQLSWRRTELENRAAVSQSLVFKQEWKVDVPRLDSSSEDADVAFKDSDVATDSPAVHVVPLRDRLAPASFADVVKVIRVWADAAERTPRAFTDLNEDALSDLLAATLNATLPGAAREVYTRGGKSDIFITADKLAEGHGPARVFVCETKWAHSDSTVAGALEPQLFGYLTVHDTAAVLLLLFPQQNPEEPKQRRLNALREDVKGYLRDSDEISGWPVLEYRVEDRIVRVCVASVFLSRYRE